MLYEAFFITYSKAVYTLICISRKASLAVINASIGSLSFFEESIPSYKMGMQQFFYYGMNIALIKSDSVNSKD